MSRSTIFRPGSSWLVVLAWLILASACGGGDIDDEPVLDDVNRGFGECPAPLGQFAAPQPVADESLVTLVDQFEAARGAGRSAEVMALLADGAVVDVGYEQSDDPTLIRELLVGFHEAGTSRSAVVVEAGDGRVVWIAEEQPFCLLERWDATVAEGRFVSLTLVAPTFFAGPIDVPLDCADGLRPPLGQLAFGVFPPGDHRPPTAIVDEFFAGSLEDNDLVEEVGGDGSRPPRVRVVREGRTVTVAYLGWAVDLGLVVELWESCRGIEPSREALDALLSEFGEPEPIQEGEPTPIWYDASGAPLARDVAISFGGPEHCGWQSATFLSLGWPLGTAGASVGDTRLYVRDPKGVVPYLVYDSETGSQTELDVSYAADVELPADAGDTGYHTDEFRVFINESETEHAIYVQTVDGTERWPRTAAGCA